MKKILLLILAGVFFILGAVGLLIPVIPQIPFFALAIVFACSGSDKIKEKIRTSSIYEKHLKKYIESNRFLSSIFKDEESQ